MNVGPSPSPDPASQDLAVSDLSNIDAQARRIDHVSQNWMLPALPDSVKLDLLGNPMLGSADEQGHFLWGLHDDLHQVTTGQPALLSGSSQQPAPAGSTLQNPTQQQVQTAVNSNPAGAVPTDLLFRPADDVQNQLRKVWNGIAGESAPDVASTSAVQELKVRAVKNGLLPADTQIDGTWDPSMNGVAAQLAQNDFQQRILGSRPGAERTKDVMDLISHWTSPTGLVTAATQLGFLPDIKQVSKDLSDGGPLGFLKAAAGVALPVLNDILLFTGVSEVVAFARGARLAEEGLQGVALADRLASGGSALGRTLTAGDAAGTSLRTLSAGKIADQVEQFREAGLVAQRLQKTGGALATIGDRMAQWRSLFPVMVAKKAVQTGMQLGLAGQLESTVDPSLSSTSMFGSGNQGDRIDAAQQAVAENGPLSTLASALELPFVPPTILPKGSISGPARAATGFLRQTITGVADDTRLTSTYFNAIRANLLARGVTDDLATFDADTRAHGPQTALINFIGGGDKQKASEVMTYLGTSAAIRKAAEDRVALLGLSPFDAGNAYQEAFHLYANKFSNQLRIMDDVDAADPASLERYARQRARADFDAVSNPEGRASITEAKAGVEQRFKSVLGDLTHDDPAVRDQAIRDAQDQVQAHNSTVRTQTLHSLFKQPGLEDYMLNHLTDAWDTVSPDRWDLFTGGQRMLEELHARNDLKFVQPISDWDWRHSSIADEISVAHLTRDDINLRKKDGTAAVDSFGGNIDPLKGHLTLMRKDSISRQGAAAIHGYGSMLSQRLASLRQGEDGLDELFGNFGKQILAKAAGADVTDPTAVTSDVLDAGRQAIGNMQSSAVAQIAADISAGGVQGIGKKTLARYADTLRWVAKNGGDPADAIKFVDGELRALDNAPFWAGSNLNIGALPFAEKLKTLGKRMPFIAAEVDVPDVMKAELAQSGYKAVYGTDFLFPGDLTGMSGPFAELTRGNMRRLSLGTFADAHSSEEVNFLREKKFRVEVSSRLKAAGVDQVFRSPEDPVNTVFHPESADVNQIVRDLRDKMSDLKTRAGDAQQIADGPLARFGTALLNSYVPTSMWDLKPSAVEDLFKATYGDEGARAIATALAKSSRLGWEYEGLGAIESHLRANSWLKGALHTFGKTETAEGLGEWTGFRRVGVGVLSGAMALAQGANPATALAVGGATAAMGAGGVKGRALAGIGAGAAAAAMGGNPVAAGLGAAFSPSSTGSLFNPRFAVGMLTAHQVGLNAAANGMDPVQASLLGIGAGVGAAQLSKLGASALEKRLFVNKGWAEYSKLGGDLARMRDRLRFSLNPFFDLHRYTQAAVLNATADLPEGVQLPLNASLGGLKAGGLRWGGFSPSEQQGWIDRFQQASSKWTNIEGLESTQRYFQQRGILGFTPTRWMAGSFAHLVNQGVDDREAAQMVRNIYTYGTKGRSGAELSANFVFFPFSFQKKYYGQLVKFASKDLGRVVLMHDALKAYDVLNDRYDLSDKLQDHLPILHDFQKMNALNFGLNVGELGGVNRPLIEGLMNTPASSVIDPVLNLFLPQAWQVSPGTDTGNLSRLAARVVPAYRDITNLIQDTAEQGHVLFSKSHETSAAETRDAFNQWNGFKQQVSSYAQQQGLSYDQLLRRKEFQPVADFVHLKRAQLDSQYPAFAQARVDAAVKSTDRQAELADIIAMPQTAAESEAAQFADLVSSVNNSLQTSQGISFTSQPDAISPQLYDAIRQTALALAKQGHGFEALYKRYWATTFGPITSEVS